MARGKSHPEEVKEQARARVAAGEQKSKVAKSLGIALSTLSGWLGQDVKDAHEQVRTDRKTKFINKAWDSVENTLQFADQKVKAATVAQEQFNELINNFTEALRESDDINARDIKEVVVALASLMDIPLNHASTFVGTIYDKIALASGDPTSRAEQVGQVTQKYVYDITQRVIQDPEQRETARDLFRRAANTNMGS